MRLTPDVVLSARQGLNCLGERTLQLRERGISVIENLAVARDGFDAIDLSQNAISSLGHGFPPFPRLSVLYLGDNRITRIQKGVADSLPNLRVLVLTSNRIASRAELNVAELARLSRLEVLSIGDNPVANEPDIRGFLLKHIPTLRFINFCRVTDRERGAVHSTGAKETGAKRRLSGEARGGAKKMRTS